MNMSDLNKKIETDNFHRLLDVIPDLHSIETVGRSKSMGYMDLCLNVLYRTPDRIVISLSHYYLHPSGDMIPDPDMEIDVFLRAERVQAISYQDIFGFQSVRNAEQEHYGDRQKNLNVFLSYWLCNLINQGHRIAIDSDVAES